MRRLLVALLAALASAVSAAPSLALPGETLTVVAGHGEVGSSVVTVAATTNGGVRGVTRIDNGPGFLFISDVRCVVTVGDTVLVGGVITKSTNPTTVGRTSLVAVEDGGPGGVDRVGIAFSFSGLDTCPVSILEFLPMRPLTSGNVAVLSV